MVYINVIDIIAATLKREYPDIRVYDEAVPQGFKTPSFFIWTISSGHERVIGRRYRREYKMAVRYFGNGNTELNAMAAELFDVLEYPEYSGVKLHGRRRNYIINDNVLHFFLDITMYLDRLPENTPEMEAIKINTNLVQTEGE